MIIWLADASGLWYGKRHALLHMVPECFDHWATWAGHANMHP